jgi:thiol:disulfide interchange protein
MKKSTIIGWSFIFVAGLWLATGCATSTLDPVVPQTADSINSRDDIKWGYSLSEGLKIAKENNKPVMVDFFASWCGPCRLMDSRVYSNDAVVRSSWGVIPVKIDADEKPGTLSKYGVTALPTVIFLTSNGQEISRITGLMPAEGMIQRIEQSIAAEAARY